ncbi:hypothetical protein VOLCADRAFT_105268 [Volvox carteri f. nagariensis]|uniref:Uncharacterized protein n=1 Tax=Volvox carteri f. nagariensis TaxID=3068 RepID=D8TZP1_VOLCA|nr:uncharacterized protein VOLCADRAFT_105268 [Volvox carteri f. nagariensis]EFJ46957.1 hypothetical protein VOLCADRAFT_105268 [Volvox carteri f. nagariensis]|eukprot:XP_002951852.1 hypothetical protein VOLCADRAFT_105268 [Volvox carteri f. nagariensis]
MMRDKQKGFKTSRVQDPQRLQRTLVCLSANSRTQDMMEAMDAIQAKMCKVKDEIAAVDEQIVACTDRDTLTDLRDKVKQLSEKLQLLREEELNLQRNSASTAVPKPRFTIVAELDGVRAIFESDASYRYIREALPPPTSRLSLGSFPAATDLRSFLEGPLARKLPVYKKIAIILENADIMDYITLDEDVAKCANTLTSIVESALLGGFGGGTSEFKTAFQVAHVVDMPLELAARAFSLNVSHDRNVMDTSGATVRLHRPGFACWINNVLLFKGEDKALASDMQVAIKELWDKMARPWVPELLPGVSMPCMIAYAAAGTMLQFFSIQNRVRGNVQLSPISSLYDLSTPLGRIRALHCTFNIVRLLASYAPHAPKIPVALGSEIQSMGYRGELLRTIRFFEDFVQKRVYNFEEQHSGVNDFSLVKELYTNAALAQCPNLVRLHTPDAIHLDGQTLVLHLVPHGVPQYGPPGDEASLKQAIRDVLTGIEALHAAGFVHRDIHWGNVIMVPGSAPNVADRFILMDLEHAGRADSSQDCRQSPFPLATWPEFNPILDSVDGRYTRASDLCLVSHCLLAYLPFELSASGDVLAMEQPADSKRQRGTGCGSCFWFGTTLHADTGKCWEAAANVVPSKLLYCGVASGSGANEVFRSAGMRNTGVWVSSLGAVYAIAEVLDRLRRQSDVSNLAEGPFEACLKDGSVQLQVSTMQQVVGVARPLHHDLFAELSLLRLSLRYHVFNQILRFWNRVRFTTLPTPLPVSVSALGCKVPGADECYEYLYLRWFDGGTPQRRARPAAGSGRRPRRGGGKVGESTEGGLGRVPRRGLGLSSLVVRPRGAPASSCQLSQF